ncbi:hypothetical protein EDB83DRAFT_2315785 [Lactarius deliciosus]|nr:hypothetical protein EDB83DRAFT_2315785 [Lactarius deliciosus]
MRRSGTHKADPPPFEPLPDNLFSRRTHPSWHDAYARCTGLFFWAVGRQPQQPLMTCACRCSATLSWMPPPSSSWTGADEHALRRSRVAGSESSFPRSQAFCRTVVRPSSPARGGLGRGAVGGSSISTPGGDRGARGAALSTYQDERMLASERDACRCVITGSVDSASARGAMVLAGAPIAAVEATSVIPPSVAIRTFSRTCSLYMPTRQTSLAASTFVSRQLRESEYQIVTWNPTTLATPRRQTTVALSTADPGARPVPSVHYLRLRAVCARAAHKSGAAV